MTTGQNFQAFNGVLDSFVDLRSVLLENIFKRLLPSLLRVVFPPGGQMYPKRPHGQG